VAARCARFSALGSRPFAGDADGSRLEIDVIDDGINANIEDIALANAESRERRTENGYAVDIMRLPDRAAFRTVVIHAVDDGAHRSTDPLLEAIRGDEALQLGEPLQSLLFHALGNVVLHLVCCGALLRRVRERAYAIELHVLEQFQECLKVRVRLARETNDARRANGDIGHDFANALDLLANRSIPFGATHAPEHFV